MYKRQEYDLAISAGVRSLFNVSPKEIIGTDQATGVLFVKTQLEDGQLVEVPGSEFVLDCDLVIKATGQAKMAAMLQGIKGLALDNSKRIIVHETTYQTGNPQYFAGGDAVNGGAEVVNGAYDGKHAAQGIHQYLSTLQTS